MFAALILIIAVVYGALVVILPSKKNMKYKFNGVIKEIKSYFKYTVNELRK